MGDERRARDKRRGDGGDMETGTSASRQPKVDLYEMAPAASGGEWSPGPRSVHPSAFAILEQPIRNITCAARARRALLGRLIRADNRIISRIWHSPTR